MSEMYLKVNEQADTALSRNTGYISKGLLRNVKIAWRLWSDHDTIG